MRDFFHCCDAWTDAVDRAAERKTIRQRAAPPPERRLLVNPDEHGVLPCSVA